MAAYTENTVEVEMGVKKSLLVCLLVFPLCLFPPIATCEVAGNTPIFLDTLIKKIPPRPDSSIAGTEFTKTIATLEGKDREKAILVQLEEGNFPRYLRKLMPMKLSHRYKNGEFIRATLFVMPDYLSIGSNRDHLLIPMNLQTALEIAGRLGFVLPTRKMVDQIFRQSSFHFRPQPLPPGDRMRSTAYYLRHNQMIEEQQRSAGCSLGALVSGHKKDLVLTNRLIRAIGKIAIYGWHRLSGIPIQPLSTIHGAGYADYSHGIRLVSEIILINGKPWSILDVLENPKLSELISDEGPIRGIKKFMALHTGMQDRSLISSGLGRFPN